MSSVNKVIILGHLGRDPEVRSFQNGGKVCNLAVATSERWTKDGEKQERTEWHKVAIFNDKLADVAEKYLRKGSQVYLEGQLETRKWQDSNGQDKYSTEIVLRPYRGELTLLGKAEAGQDSHSQAKANAYQAQSGGAVMDDDIPFAPSMV